MARMQATHATEQVAQPKRGVFGRLFRRSPKASDCRADNRDRTPSPQGSQDDGTREEMPEMHPDATPPPSPKSTKKVQLKPPKKETKPSTPRSAAEAAFSGPPKYSWADIVSPLSIVEIVC